MSKREEKKRKQEKLDLINRSTERRPMPRPTVFRDKSKYDRGRQKALDRPCLRTADLASQSVWSPHSPTLCV